MTNDKINYAYGPYKYRKDKDGYDDCYDIIAGNGMSVLASLPFWDEGDEDGIIEATARLFAAAPELIETLESLIDQISGLEGISSVIDEELVQGDAFKQGVVLLASLKR